MKKISVVIPALNESKVIGNLLRQLTEMGPFFEIIVVDGGSTDPTRLEIDKFNQVLLVESLPGRAKQMNAGARAASGDILWFLHADSTAPEDSKVLIQEALRNTSVAGSFYLQFDLQNFWLNLYSKISRLNLSIFTYGDQGIFVCRQTFNDLGGFKDIPIMEDLDFVRRVRRTGNFTKLPRAIITSARRFEKNGVIWQEVKNVALVMGYYLGISPHFLSKFYRY